VVVRAHDAGCLDPDSEPVAGLEKHRERRRPIVWRFEGSELGDAADPHVEVAAGQRCAPDVAHGDNGSEAPDRPYSL
jgi:hypothetical protein